MEMNARRTAPDGRLPGDQSKLNLPLGPLPILGGASSRVSCRACQARRVEPPSDKRVLRRAGLFRRGRPAAGVVLGRARTVVLDDALLAPKALGAGRAVEDVDGAAVGHGPRRRQRAQQGAGQGRETHCALERGWRRGWLADGGPTTALTQAGGDVRKCDDRFGWLAPCCCCCAARVGMLALFKRELGCHRRSPRLRPAALRLSIVRIGAY